MPIKQYNNVDYQGTVRPINVPDPTNPQDAATKNYVDLLVTTGTAYKEQVEAATVAALPANTVDTTGMILTASANAALPTLDGYTVNVNDRLLIKNEVAAVNNGIYVATNLGSSTTPWVLTRAPDADQNTPPDIRGGTAVAVVNGVVCGNSLWVQTSDPVVIGTTAQVWVLIGAGQADIASISKGGTGVTTAAAARGTGSLGAAATGPVGPAVDKGIPLMVAQTINTPTAAGSPYTITHNLGTTDVIVQVFDLATFNQIMVNVAAPTVNTVTISVDTNVPDNVRVVILGA